MTFRLLFLCLFINNVIADGLVSNIASFFGFSGEKVTVLPKKVKLKCTRIKKENIARFASYSGRIKSSKSVTITADKRGIIKKLHRSDNELVKEGDIILELENSSESGMLKSATGKMKMAKYQYDSTKTLHKKGNMSNADVLMKEAEYNSAQGDYERALAEYNRTMILAPFDGTLGLHQYSKGSTVYENKDLVSIISRSAQDIFIEFALPESVVSSITSQSKTLVGMDVEIIFDEKGDILPKIATIYAMEPQATDTNMVMIRAKFKKADKENLVIGSFVRVNVEMFAKDGVLAIPASAILTTPQLNQFYVYKVESGIAMKVPIKIGARDGKLVEIIDGLKEGGVVSIESGLMNIDGMEVDIIDQDKNNSSDNANKDML